MNRRFSSLTLTVSLTVLMLSICGGKVAAEAPPISDPDMRAPAGSMPGTFPTTVTASNVNSRPIPGSVVDGPGSNNLRVSFPAGGPIKWTQSRHNEGDMAMLIGPFDPNDPSFFPPDDFVDDYKPLEGGQPFANTTLAWRVSRERGALMATVRHNGVDNQDLSPVDGVTPFGTTHGVAYFNADFGQGWGYRMSDGVFANGGGSSADLQTGIAGFGSEGSFNTAVAYFPYEQGWLGAYVNSESTPATFATGNPDVDPSSVVWANGSATVNLPGIDPLNDGMLFVTPTNGGNDSDIAAAFPTASGWQVTVREDDNFDVTGQTVNGAGFQFLYIPYDANDQVGGHVSGLDGSLINSGGDSRFTVTRRSEGEFAVRVLAGDGVSPLTEDDGMLLLSVAGALPGSTTLADRKFLSYEFDSTSGDFIVQSRELVAINSPNSQNVNGDELALRDVDFYFSFVDFANPVSLGTTVCDLDGDGSCGVADLRVLYDEIAAGTVGGAADLDGNGVVDNGDISAWLAAAGTENGQSYAPGDVDLDGSVGGGDFTALASSFGNVGLPGAYWDQGNFDGNEGGEFSVGGGDFTALASSFGQTSVSAVPEPASLSLLVLGMILVTIRKRG